MRTHTISMKENSPITRIIKIKTVLLTLVSEEEIRQLSNGHKPRELLPNVIARILLEAEEQGGVL